MFSFDHTYVVITLQEKNRVYGIEMPLKGGQQGIIENIKTATVKEYHENKTMVLIHRTNYDFYHFHDLDNGRCDRLARDAYS